MPTAILLLAYGGPESLDDVAAYLQDVRGGRATPPELVEEIRNRYALIGGRSPLLDITRLQASGLRKQLNSLRPPGAEAVRVYVGMRHWKPYIRDVVEQIYQDGFRSILALCMAPYYSRMSIGAYRERLQAAVNQVCEQTGEAMHYQLIESWFDHPSYIEALARHVGEGLARFPADRRDSVQVLFTAHSLPAPIMSQGDPYAEQHEQTAALAARAAGLSAGQWQVGYQSAPMAGNVRWLGPSIEEMLESLAGQGMKQVLIAPIGFVADHVEVLYDIDIEAQELTESLGIHLERTESMNDSPDFVQALAEIVQAHAGA